MKKITLFLLLFLFLALNITAQENDQNIDYYELMMPGEEHKLLHKFVGQWDQEYRFFMAPGADPTISNGKMNAEMILGGRFLQAKASGEAMGTMIESLVLMGYDKRLNIYTASGFDTMGTYAVSPTGSYDKNNKTLTLTGENYEVTLKDYSQYRMVYFLDKEDEYKFELYFTFPEKEEIKYLEIISKRTK